MAGGVFISHASIEAHLAHRVVAALETAGLPCWIAPRDIPEGSDFTASLLTALHAAPVLVLLSSAAANASPHVRRELEVAVGSGSEVVAVRLERIPPSPALQFFIGTRQWLEAVGEPEEWLPRLVAAVRLAMETSGAGPAVHDVAGDGPGRPLPQVAGTTWGRDEICDQVHDLVLDGRRRLVSLTGPGGIGKTRIALVVAERLRREGHEVHYLAADATTAAEDLLPLIADALGCIGVDPLAALATLPPTRQPLVVIDNAEFVPDAARLGTDVPSSTAGLTLLVVGRVPLRVAGEHVVRVQRLALPPVASPPDAVPDYPAVQLLADAATRSGSFVMDGQEQGAADLCRVLDGVPLALELAAARLPVLGVQGVLAGVRTSLDLLVSTSPAVPDRQRSVAATIQWAVDRLTPDERVVLARLSVFEGPFSLEAADAVCPEHGSTTTSLAAFLDAGLLSSLNIDDSVRYELPGTVRVFGRTLLGGAEARAAYDALAGHLLGELTSWAGWLDTGDSSEAVRWFGEVAADVEATTDAQLDAGNVDVAADLTVAAGRFWILSGRLTGPLAQAQRVRERATDEGLSARLHATAGRLAYQLNDWEVAARELGAARDLAERRADAATLAEADCYLGATLLMTGQTERGAELATRAFEASRELDLYPLAAEALSVIAISHAVRGEYDAERQTHERRLDVVRSHGDLARTADALNTLAEIALDEDDAETARSYAAEALALASSRLPLMGRDATITLARAALAAGEDAEGARLLRDALGRSTSIGQDLAVAQCLRVGGTLAVRHDQAALGVRLFASAQSASPSPSGTDSPVERDLADGLSQARSRIGEKRAAVEWRLGRSLPLPAVLEDLQGLLDTSWPDVPPA